MRLAEATLRYMPPDTDVDVVPYGVDLDRFRPHEREPARRAGRRQRRQAVAGEGAEVPAARRWRESCDRQPNVRVLLAGDGPERRSLERLAKRLGLADRVEFAGEVAHEQVPEVLARMDVFAMPSTWEGFGVAALEAAAMELPVVASNIHGIPDVVEDGVTGILVPPKDVGALSQAIVASAARRRRATAHGPRRTRDGRGALLLGGQRAPDGSALRRACVSAVVRASFLDPASTAPC